MINIKNLDPNKIKKDEKAYKNILIYHIGYVMVKDLSCYRHTSDDDLPLNKILKLCNMIIVLRSVFYKGSKYCSHVFLDE